ncbi:MAG: hypothetical protein M3120_09310 [Pseudomonadota bacterium]|nr:hypothetical protein [Pseudomonadota bacterium]
MYQRGANNGAHRGQPSQHWVPGFGGGLAHALWSRTQASDYQAGGKASRQRCWRGQPAAIMGL